MTDPTPLTPEALARLFHEAYERLAPSHGYETRKASAVPWDEVPEPNKSLMVAVAGEVLPAVTARVLADVAARLPEALAALALASNLGADYDADSILEALRNA